MFYVFHGDDDFSCAEEIAALTAKMGDAQMAELNTTRLDGRAVALDELLHHCDTIPFLFDRRLVIVDGLLSRLSPKGASGADRRFLEALLEYLPDLPDTTRLIFVESSKLPPRHPVLQLARANSSGYAKAFTIRSGRSLTRWVQSRVKREGGAIDSHTAEILASFVGPDLYALHHEIQKLVAYTDGQRPITEEDIRLLTPHARQASIFDLVDALGRREGRTASRIYHELLDSGEHPLGLLGMIARQFRLMIQVKELAPKLLTAEAIASELGQSVYPVRKVMAQSGNYTVEQLGTIYRKLLDTDLDIKTGRLEPTLALDTLIAGLSRVA